MEYTAGTTLILMLKKCILHLVLACNFDPLAWAWVQKIKPLKTVYSYPKTLLCLENRKLHSYGGLVVYVTQALVKPTCLQVITADSMATFALHDLWLPQITTCTFIFYSNLLHAQFTGLPCGLPRPTRMKFFDILLT